MTTTAATASAQNPFEIGGAAGVAIPMGDLGDFTDMGFNATFLVGYNPAYLPIGIRFDAAYNEFGFSDNVDGNINVASFTANGVFKLPTGGFTPYLIGGGGLYRVDADSPFLGSTNAENKFGFNVGGGISMPLSGFKVFVEARYNRVSMDGGNLSYLPIVFGASF